MLLVCVCGGREGGGAEETLRIHPVAAGIVVVRPLYFICQSENKTKKFNFSPKFFYCCETVKKIFISQKFTHQVSVKNSHATRN